MVDFIVDVFEWIGKSLANLTREKHHGDCPNAVNQRYKNEHGINFIGNLAEIYEAS